jgi:hypothetical protein
MTLTYSSRCCGGTGSEVGEGGSRHLQAGQLETNPPPQPQPRPAALAWPTAPSPSPAARPPFAKPPSPSPFRSTSLIAYLAHVFSNVFHLIAFGAEYNLVGK